MFMLCFLSCYFTSAWIRPLFKFLDSLNPPNDEIKPHWVFSAVGHLVVLLLLCGYVVSKGFYSYINNGTYLWDDYFIGSLCIMISIPLVSMFLIIPCMLVFDCKNMLPERSHLPVRRQPIRRIRRGRNEVSGLRRAKIQKMLKGFSRMFKFKRTVPNTTSDIVTELAESHDITEENEEEVNNLPSYENIMLEGLPSYDSLKLKQISFGRKVLVVDKKLSMLTFDNTTTV